MSWSSLLNPLLVLASFSPLFLLWAIQGPPTPIQELIQAQKPFSLWGMNFTVSSLMPYEIICLAAILMPNLFLLSEIKHSENLNITQTLSVVDTKGVSDYTVVYLIANLMPLFQSQIQSFRDFFAMLTAFLIIIILFTKLGIYYTNIILLILGYQIFEVSAQSSLDSLNNTKQYFILSKQKFLDNNNPLVGYQLTPTVLIERVG